MAQDHQFDKLFKLVVAERLGQIDLDHSLESLEKVVRIIGAFLQFYGVKISDGINMEEDEVEVEEDDDIGKPDSNDVPHVSPLSSTHLANLSLISSYQYYYYQALSASYKQFDGSGKKTRTSGPTPRSLWLDRYSSPS